MSGGPSVVTREGANGTAKVVSVECEDGYRLFRITVKLADLTAPTGPHRAEVRCSTGAWEDPALAEMAGRALLLAAHHARRSDERPLGFSPRLGPSATHDPAHVLVDDLTEEERAELHPTRDEPLFLYRNPHYDWELGEPVYSVGQGARVLYRIAESRITVIDEVPHA